MEKQALVSICIPVFNGDKYLRECLDSALSQSYRNIEIVIIDDGSSDGSLNIIKEYCLKESRIIYFLNKKNLGLVSNWNECIQHSSGEWIKFLFQDDYLSSDCIERMLQCAKNGNNLIACKRTFLINSDIPQDIRKYYDNGVATFQKYGITEELTYITPRVISNFATKNISMNFIGEPTNIMFKKSLIDEIGIFNQNLEQIGDLEFALRVASVYGVAYLHEELAFFRIHENSTTNRNLATKNYSLVNLEPAKFAHLLLFNDSHGHFRKNLSWFNFNKLKLYFYLRRYEAVYNLGEAAVNRREYDLAIEKFPMLKLPGNGSLLIKILYQLLLEWRRFKN